MSELVAQDLVLLVYSFSMFNNDGHDKANTAHSLAAGEVLLEAPTAPNGWGRRWDLSFPIFATSFVSFNDSL